MMLRMTERANLVSALADRGLELSLAAENPPKTLLALCRRIDENQISADAYSGCKAIQQEMLNEGFYPYLRKFESSGMEISVIDNALKELHLHGESALDYTPERLLPAIRIAAEFGAFYDYLKHFSGMGLTDEQNSTIAKNLCLYRRLLEKTPSELTEEERMLFAEPCMADTELISSPDETLPLLARQPELLSLIKFMYDSGLRHKLSLECHKNLSADPEAAENIISRLLETLGFTNMFRLMAFWSEAGCLLRDLNTAARMLEGMNKEQVGEALRSRGDYYNTLYGHRIKGFAISNVGKHRESILVYAITNNKKGFIKLIEEDYGTFICIPTDSVLFNERFYAGCVNINSLNAKNLRDCAEMPAQKVHYDLLEQGRIYTFEEIKALHGQAWQYYHLYARLGYSRIDEKLIALRQMTKTGLLDDMNEESAIEVLAKALSQKPLSDWMRQEFAGIDGLTQHDAVRLLTHMDKLSRLVPQMKVRADAMIVLKNHGNMQGFLTIAELKANIVEVDGQWKALVDKMGIDKKFLQKNEDRVIEFLCKNGAEITSTYYGGIDGAQRESLKRIVKAELMGKFSELKYYADDLAREIGYPISENQKRLWGANIKMVRGKITVREHDDFFSTVTVGTTPQKTCLSYDSGVYRECLMATFDSNKKILYAHMDGRIVGRAIIRLTKGSFQKTSEGDGASLSFADLEQEDGTQDAARYQERLILFLERPYTSTIAPDAQDEVYRLFVELVDKKANKLGVMPVLSNYYHMSGYEHKDLYIYISRSKAGMQYLDSLDGSADAHQEGSYKMSSLYVRNKDAKLNHLLNG